MDAQIPSLDLTVENPKTWHNQTEIEDDELLQQLAIKKNAV